MIIYVCYLSLDICLQDEPVTDKHCGTYCMIIYVYYLSPDICLQDEPVTDKHCGTYV